MKNSCVHTRTRIFLSEICLRRVIFALQVIFAGQVVRQSQGIALLPFRLIKNNTDNTEILEKYLTRCVCYAILHINSTDSTRT